jgi:hypothetical protein
MNEMSPFRAQFSRSGPERKQLPTECYQMLYGMLDTPRCFLELTTYHVRNFTNSILKPKSFESKAIMHLPVVDTNSMIHGQYIFLM